MVLPLLPVPVLQVTFLSGFPVDVTFHASTFLFVVLYFNFQGFDPLFFHFPSIGASPSGPPARRGHGRGRGRGASRRRGSRD